MLQIAKNTTEGGQFRKPTEMTLQELQKMTYREPQKFAAEPVSPLTKNSKYKLSSR